LAIAAPRHLGHQAGVRIETEKLKDFVSCLRVTPAIKPGCGLKPMHKDIEALGKESPRPADGAGA
jgi:hypothetical protein